MPTTDNEAERIIAIATKYISLHKLYCCFVELDEEVGKKSENDSVKQSFAMFRGLAEKAKADYLRGLGMDSIPDTMPFFYAAMLTLFVGLVGFHMALICMNVVSIFLVIRTEFWWLCFPLATMMGWGLLSPITCPLTVQENRLRILLGRRPISSFVGHYFLKPLRWLLSRR